MSKRNTTLSKKRVLITILLFLAIPIGAKILNRSIQQYDISLMFTFNIFGSLIIFYDWNLFGVHYNRAKYNIDDTILYTIVAYVALMIWTIFSLDILHCRIILPTGKTLTSFGYARLGMLISDSFIEAFSFSITIKSASDQLSISGREIPIILLTGLIAGITITFLFLPSHNLLTILTTILYNVILLIFLSYIYNQCGSFFPGAIAFALCNLTIMITAMM